MERRRTKSLKDPSVSRLRYGYDTANKASVVDGRYVRCPNAETDCKCYGCRHQGMIPGFSAKISERRNGKSVISRKIPKAG